MEELYSMIKFDKSTFIHIGVCFLITALVGLFFYFVFWFQAFPSALAGVISAMLCGIGKEYADHLNPLNCFNWGDIIGNVIGSAIAFILFILIF